MRIHKCFLLNIRAFLQIVSVFLFSFLPIAQAQVNCQKAKEPAYKILADFYKQPQPPSQCCKGLKMMGAFAYINGQCERLKGGSAFCMPCGDGICDHSEFENICNCPQDCKTVRSDCAKAGELMATKESSTIQSVVWYARKCCPGLRKEYFSEELSKCVAK